MNRNYNEFSIPYLPLLIQLTCCESVQLPDFLGSTLRGAVGWALLSNKPLYKYLFDNGRLTEGKQDIVHPYVIVPPPYGGIYKAGDELFFQILLIGDASGFAMSLIHTLAQKQCLALGSERKKFTISKILQGNRLSPIWLPGTIYPSAVKTDVICCQKKAAYQNCSIQLLTPLRIRRDGELLRQIDFPTIIRNISRRIIELTDRYGGHANRKELTELCRCSLNIQMISSSLKVREMQRYSSRKKDKMDFDGLMGALMFQGNLESYRSLLYAAQILHIGRNVTMGFGQIKVAIW